jgi:hypothetical protein
MAEVVREGDGLGKVFVEPQRAGQVSRNACDLDGVTACASGRRAVGKTCVLYSEPAERARMNHQSRSR